MARVDFTTLDFCELARLTAGTCRSGCTSSPASRTSSTDTTTGFNGGKRIRITASAPASRNKMISRFLLDTACPTVLAQIHHPYRASLVVTLRVGRKGKPEDGSSAFKPACGEAGRLSPRQNFCQRLDVIGDATLHRSSHVQTPMNPAEIIPGEMQAKGSPRVFPFFTERVR